MTFQELPQLTDRRRDPKLVKHKTKVYTKRKGKITHIAVHHSLTDSGDYKAFSRYHVESNNWPSIGYTFVINKDGSIDWCLDLNIKSYHVGNSNDFAVGICLVGDFRDYDPTPEQRKSLYDLCNTLMKDLNIPVENVLGHSEYKGYEWKKCPVISMDKVRKDLKSK